MFLNKTKLCSEDSSCGLVLKKRFKCSRCSKAFCGGVGWDARCFAWKPVKMLQDTRFHASYVLFATTRLVKFPLRHQITLVTYWLPKSSILSDFFFRSNTVISLERLFGLRYEILEQAVLKFVKEIIDGRLSSLLYWSALDCRIHQGLNVKTSPKLSKIYYSNLVGYFVLFRFWDAFKYFLILIQEVVEVFLFSWYR